MISRLGTSFVLLICVASSCCQLSRDKNKLMNWCLNSETHKNEPGKVDSLHKQCSPWRDHACCTDSTTVNIHTTDMYNFTFDHCAEQTGRKMSDLCRRHFVLDNCFYHCEPHIGLWVVETKRKIASERFVNVPLCASDCEGWFEDCKDDFTCVYNWPRDFKFKQGRNTCPADSQCMTFSKMYKSAKDFCENVYDESWKYTPDNEHCMQVQFNGTNPNRAVAEFYVDKYLNSASSISLNFLLLFPLTIYSLSSILS